MAIPYKTAKDRLEAVTSTQPLFDQYEAAVNAAMKAVRALKEIGGPNWIYTKNLSRLQDEFHDFINNEVERIRTERRTGRKGDE